MRYFLKFSTYDSFSMSWFDMLFPQKLFPSKSCCIQRGVTHKRPTHSKSYFIQRVFHSKSCFIRSAVSPKLFHAKRCSTRGVYVTYEFPFVFVKNKIHSVYKLGAGRYTYKSAHKAFPYNVEMFLLFWFWKGSLFTLSILYRYLVDYSWFIQKINSAEYKYEEWAHKMGFFFALDNGKSRRSLWDLRICLRSDGRVFVNITILGGPC